MSKRRPRARGPLMKSKRHLTGDRAIFATVDAGQQSKMYAADVHFPPSRPCRITHITGTASMFVGTVGLLEVVLYDHSEKTAASSGAITVVPGKACRFHVKPSPGVGSMWIDATTTDSRTLLLAHFDYVCISKASSDFKILVNAKVHYEVGEEILENSCPAFTVLPSLPVGLQDAFCESSPSGSFVDLHQ